MWSSRLCDQVGPASAVIKMQAPSEDWTHDPGLQDQCSSHWAMEAYSIWRLFYDSHALYIEILYELIYNNPALIR